MKLNRICYICQNEKAFTLIGKIKKKPERETNFNISVTDYHREIWECQTCKVFNNFHNYDLKNLYFGKYNQLTYANKILENYKKIMDLPEGKSDNKERVKRIFNFSQERGFDIKKTSLLDIGSGLCVFLGEFKKYGSQIYCIDPDPIAVNHAKENVGVDNCWCSSDFNSIGLDMKFDIITFNKVLEHVPNPVEYLSNAAKYLKEDGFIYIELPDGQEALKNGSVQKREEFFIDHYTIFSVESIHNYIKYSNFKALITHSIYEPSDKYSVYSFISL